MQFMGGKARSARHLTEVMLRDSTGRNLFLEPFLGGCNVLPLMAPHFTAAVGADLMPDLALLWRAAIDGWRAPADLTREEYLRLRDADPSPLRAFAGFGCSFGGKWFGGYASSTRGGYARMASEGIERKAEPLRRANVLVRHLDYRAHKPAAGDVVYLDPPFVGTTAYAGAERWYPYEFWETAERWALAGAEIFISEHVAPRGWVPIWQKPSTRTLNSAFGPAAQEIERLFVHASQASTLDLAGFLDRS